MSKMRKRFKNKKAGKTFDDELSKELSEIIDTLTHTGNSNLISDETQKVIHICKQSDKYVKETYNIIMEHLQEAHAEVRLSAFQICDEVFRASHCFREQVIFNLELLIKLTTEANLPPPESVARKLKQEALRTIHKWNSSFGMHYTKLFIGYSYLKNVKKVDFDALVAADAATQAKQQANLTHLEGISGLRIKKVLAEFNEKETDIKSAAASLSNCINLLLPHPDDFFIKEDNLTDDMTKSEPLIVHQQDISSDASDSDDLGDAGLREVGMVNTNHSIQLSIDLNSEPCIEETAENTAIIENAQENAKLINYKYLPCVKAWLEILSKSSEHKEEQKNLIELKGELDDVMFKYGRLSFYSADNVSSDSELEEVPEPMEIKPALDQSRPGCSALWNITSEEGITGDPASQSRPVSVKTEPSDVPHSSKSTSIVSKPSNRKQKLLAVAPKLPFDVDLYHWEDEKLPVPTLLPSSTDGHRFWVGTEGCMDELPVPEGSAALRTRVIEFSGHHTPVKHSCRVRLPSGKLCPRQDRYKCPFHGEIVPRDEKGDCINPKDAIRMQELTEKRQQEKPDWQDPKLLAEIKKATGVDLKMPEKGKRKKRKQEYSGLTDLKQIENTAKNRLEKKIFNKSVMRKVAADMDKLDQRKFKDKYGDQFNYFYNS